MVHGVGTVGANLHFEDSVIAIAADAFDRDPNQSQIFRQLAVINRQRNKFTYPLGRKFHSS